MSSHHILWIINLCVHGASINLQYQAYNVVHSMRQTDIMFNLSMQSNQALDFNQGTHP